MQNIIIDEQFKDLLPKLDEVTYRGLEASVLEYGCYMPLVLWKDILIDGYNRYLICTEHDIPFSTINMEFDKREEVEIWMIRNQVDRRNLPPIQLSFFRGLHYRADKKLHGDIGRTALNNASVQNEHLQTGSTSRRLAEQYNVSAMTIRRDEKLAEALIKIGEISSDAKQKILSGEIAVNKSKLEELASATEGDIKTIALDIEQGTYNRRTPRITAALENAGLSEDALAEIRQLNTIISSFAKSFDNMLREHSAGSPLELKKVIRSYIDQLEELYSRV